MAGTANQKLKTLYIKRLLETETDPEHGVTLERIISYLASYGITAERKSIYSDLELLRSYGMDIGTRRGKHTEYMLLSREFELPELKLLVDAVGASRFITRKKSTELIRKISQLTSVQEAKELQRQVFVDRRVKMMNESIYYSVDAIHEAVNSGKQLSFKYFDYSVDQRRVFRRDGGEYNVSPLALLYSDDNYYLAAYSPDRSAISNYRVDRMVEVKVLDVPREDNQTIRDFDPAAYINSQFSMFGGSRRQVEIIFHNSLSTVVLDRFGSDLRLHPVDADHFLISTEVEMSPAFFSWVFMFGQRARILGPADVEEAFANMVEMVADNYSEGLEI